MTPWLLVDYGEVISLPYDPASHDEIAAILGCDPDPRYWEHRPAYDAGQSSADYWPLVAGRDVTPAEVARLDAVDLRGWGRVVPAMLAFLDDQRAAGTRLALLSNAPHNQADVFVAAPWANGFEHVFVSSRLGVVKPDRVIFERVLTAMGAAPHEVTFVDDREVNVRAAADLGIRAVLFTGVAALRHALA